jgi:chromosome segregation ATPase
MLINVRRWLVNVRNSVTRFRRRLFVNQNDLNEITHKLQIQIVNGLTNHQIEMDSAVENTHSVIENINKSIANLKATQKNHSLTLSEIKKCGRHYDKYTTKLDKEREDIQKLLGNHSTLLDKINSKNEKIEITKRYIKALSDQIMTIEQRHVTKEEFIAVKGWYENILNLDKTLADLHKLHKGFTEETKIQLGDARKINNDFKNAMEIQCSAHLTQLKLAIQEWDKKHK